MITELLISYPWWSIIFVLIIGLVFSGILYFRNPQNKYSTGVTITLFLLRFLSVSLLSFLLLSPFIKTKKKLIEKPIIIIGQDNSSSVVMTKDSLFYKNDLNNEINNLRNNLSEYYDVDSYIFGDGVTQKDIPDNLDVTSDYSEFLAFIKQNYSGLNVGAILLSGDGIFNQGIDPVYAASDIKSPIFTIALGDTIQSRDIKIDDVRHNSIVYTGDIFPVEVSIAANKLTGKKTNLRLFENNKEISHRKIDIKSDNFRETINLSIKSSVAGKHRYSLIVESLEGELITKNNRKDIFIDIQDSRLKILVLANGPHPDIGAIKQSLEHNPNFEVDIEYISRASNNVKNYDVIVLYQIPSNLFLSQDILDDISNNNISTLYVLGKNSRLDIFNKYYNGLSISSSVGIMAQARFEFDKKFSLFSFSSNYVTQLASLPPLSAPLANYQLIDGTEVFAWQKISDVETDFPLIAYSSNLKNRNAVLVGEGIWLWRIQSYSQFNNTQAIDAFLSKTIMYLTSETDKRKFKVVTEGVYNVTNDISISAELYNDALEPTNSVDVDLILNNESKEVFNFIFSPFENHYRLNLNKLPVGVYSYKAVTKLGNNKYEDFGEFIVQHTDYEIRNLNANHRLLVRLAKDHNGEMYSPYEIEELINKVENLGTLKSKTHYQNIFTSLNSILLIMVIILILFIVEWFLRKYFGSY